MFIVSSAQDDPTVPIPVERFAFQERGNGHVIPSEFILVFEHNNIIYRYELRATTKCVIFEALYRKEVRFRYLFERTKKDDNSYELKHQDIGYAGRVTQRSNASFISSALLQNQDFAKEISEYFSHCYDNLSFWGRTGDCDTYVNNVQTAAQFYHDNSSTLRTAESLLRKFDLGVHGIKVQEFRINSSDKKEIKILVPTAEHKVDGKAYSLSLLKESRGTQCLFVLLYHILPVLEKGGVAIIDEFETGLHSHMVRAIVELFLSRETNPKGAQLIASFHTDYLLRDVLEKYQIVITEKDQEDLSTNAWRLDQMEGAPRGVDNIFSKYHAGAFGGIPNL